jgi:hypothetical protein
MNPILSHFFITINLSLNPLFNNQAKFVGSYHTINGDIDSSNQPDVFYIPSEYAIAHPEQWACY